MKVELSGHYSIKRLLTSCLPMIAMMLVTSVYSIVDGLFISNFAGNTAFAAMNLVWPAIALIAALGLMIGTGGSALVSKTFGEGHHTKANTIFTMLIRLCIIAGTGITIVFFILMRPIVIALGAEGALIEPAVTYGRIVVISMPAFILQMAFQSFFMTAEKPQLGTIMSIISGCLNIILDAIFVAGLGFGLTGAAIATSISLTIGGMFPIWYFASHRNNSQLKFLNASGVQSFGIEWMYSHTPADWHHIGRSCTNGMSEFIGNIALNIVSICYNLQLMRFIGENGVSAYGIIMYTGFIFASVFIGYNTCVTQVIAFNYGAGNKAEMRSLLHKSLVIALLAGMAMTALSEILAPTLAHIFIRNNPELTQMTIHAIRLYMLSFLICGINMFTSAWFTALNNGIISAIAAFARTLVFELGAVFILPSILGIEGIWYSVSVAEVFALILSLALILAFRKRYLD